MVGAVVVVPCFNEARRLDTAALAELLDPRGDIGLLLVDDGSSDATLELLNAFAATSDAVEVLPLGSNQGKAEAVRQGLLAALSRPETTIVGYYDADLSTPPGEMKRLVAELQARPELQVVLASRVRLLGRQISRYARRHYLGRVFATFASLALDVPVYDTQCGAKALRATPALREALTRPFASSWVLDVELLGRLLYPDEGSDLVPLEAVVELPLVAWHDVAGSKLNLRGMAKAAFDLAKVARDIRRRPSFRRLQAEHVTSSGRVRRTD